jgi:hypothetical protein
MLVPMTWLLRVDNTQQIQYTRMPVHSFWSQWVACRIRLPAMRLLQALAH